MASVLMHYKEKSLRGISPGSLVAPETRTTEEEASKIPLQSNHKEQLNVSVNKVAPELSTARVLALGAALLAVGTLGFYFIPGLLQADDEEFIRKSNRWVDAFYCSTVTLTTIGFGDICPSNVSLTGKIFLILFSFSGLGLFCGPILQLASSWSNHIPGGSLTLGSLTLGLGVTIFTTFESLDQMEAIYVSVITGTTIGYGDITPKTDIGKIAVSIYAIIAIDAIAILLEPARLQLEALCRVKPDDTKLA